MKTVSLHGQKAAGRVALVDDGDYDTVMGHRWRVFEWKRDGQRTRGPYAVANVFKDGRRTIVAMHQLLTGWPLTDHVNHNGLDNRRANLRPATKAQNSQNSRSQLGSSSQYKGLNWVSRDRAWRAGIRHQGKGKHLGFFTTQEDAARAYDAAAQELYGKYAVLNLPEFKGHPVPLTRSGRAWIPLRERGADPA